MTPREDTVSTEPEQVAPLCIELPCGLWLDMPDTWSNRRALMIFLRCLRRADGRPVVTYEQITQALGYADRRDVHNYWGEFETCGRDLLAYLSRRQKVDAEVVERCEPIWRAHPLWTPAQVQAEVVQRWPALGARLTVQNIRTAGQPVLRRQLAEGQVQYKEPVLIEALFGLAGAKVECAP